MDRYTRLHLLLQKEIVWIIWILETFTKTCQTMSLNYVSTKYRANFAYVVQISCNLHNKNAL